MNQAVRIAGVVAPGFESVRELYENSMHTMAEDNTQLCVYYRGEKVVDLWGSATGDSSFAADSLVNVFSSSKNLETLAIATLVDKGLLSYNAKIRDYWPEFGANGKADITIADLMRHEAGLASFGVSLDVDDLLVPNIKQNRIGRIIENLAPIFGKNPRSRRQYHAITRGWILNEVYRRVDPAGRTIGEFLREDISGPLAVDVILGLREDELERVSKIKPLGFGFEFLESLKPRLLGRRVVHNVFQILGRIIRMIPALLRGGSSMRGVPPYKGMNGIDLFNERGVAMGEAPSANANCSARGLAKIAAVLAAGGSFDSTEYLSKSAWQAMHDYPTRADMGGYLPTTFTQGGVALFTECGPHSSTLEHEFNDGREGFYGWMGLGGSIFQWHPELDIGFAFVPTSLHVLDFLNERGKIFQAEVLRCVRAGSEPAPALSSARKTPNPRALAADETSQ